MKYASRSTLFVVAALSMLAAATILYAANGQAPGGPPGRGFSVEAEAAANVVRTYYAALAARDYRRAYAQWGQNGAASGKSYAEFAAGFAQTRSTAVRIVQVGEPEGAAGSIIVSVGVEVEAVLAGSERQHFTGSYTVRRVNDVPGATADQLRWHIASASLRAVRP